MSLFLSTVNVHDGLSLVTLNNSTKIKILEHCIATDDQLSNTIYMYRIVSYRITTMAVRKKNTLYQDLIDAFLIACDIQDATNFSKRNVKLA